MPVLYAPRLAGKARTLLLSRAGLRDARTDSLRRASRDSRVPGCRRGLTMRRVTTRAPIRPVSPTSPARSIPSPSAARKSYPPCSGRAPRLRALPCGTSWPTPSCSCGGWWTPWFGVRAAGRLGGGRPQGWLTPGRASFTDREEPGFTVRTLSGPAGAGDQMSFQNLLLLLGAAALEEFGEDFSAAHLPRSGKKTR